MNDAKATTGRQIRSVSVVIFYVGIAGFIALSILWFAGFAMVGSFPSRYRDVVDDPGGDFTLSTGLEWPATASVISVDDTHGGFLGDGEFHIIFDTDRATLEKWLAESPPWEQHNWKSGPVPNEIRYCCSFGLGGVSSRSYNGGPIEYAGDTELLRVLSSNQIWYAAKERCCESLRWSNGNLLIIDFVNNRVWLCNWDS